MSSSMEHLNGCGLVHQHPASGNAEAVPCPGPAPMCVVRLPGSEHALGQQRCCEIGELLGQQGRQLVAGLRCLQSPRCGLARCYKRRHLRTVGVEIGDDAGLPPATHPGVRRPRSASVLVHWISASDWLSRRRRGVGWS